MFILCSKEFVRIGRYFCSYKSFIESLKPRHYLDSEVMNVWVEKFNREAKIVAQKNPREKKKYAFTQFMVVSSTSKSFLLFSHSWFSNVSFMFF
jgi:hypothetical protein